MMDDKVAIKHILGSKIQIEKLYPLKHPGSGMIKIFTLKNDKTKYLLKSYSKQKYADRETKNLDNINLIELFDKPLYYGKYKNFFVQEYINGTLFQSIINKSNPGQLSNYYLTAVKNLTIIHSSKNFIKDKRRLSRIFEEKSLENRLHKALSIIKEIGIPAYIKIVGRPGVNWYKSLRKVNIFKITKDLGIKKNNYILGHGDYKPDNIIFKNDKKIFVIDWFGMSKAQPWYDLAYLLVYLNKSQKITYLKYYLQAMNKKGLLLNVSINKAIDLLNSGIIFQQIMRAKSNCHKIKTRKDKHHISELKEALDGLTKEI